MSDPKRWRDPGADAPSHLRELVARAPKTRAMSTADRVRAAASIGRLAAVKPVATLATGLWVKAAAIAVSVGLASTLAIVAHRASAPRATSSHAPSAPTPRAPPPPPNAATAAPLAPSVAEPQPAVVPPVLPVPAAVVLPVPAPHAPSPLVATRAVAARSVAHASAAVAPPAVDAPLPAVAAGAPGATTGAVLGAIDAPTTASATPDLEYDRLVRAGQLVAHDPAAALRELDAEDVRYPHSGWADYRAEVRVRALIRLDRLDEARACGATLIAAYPRSPAARLVRHALARLAAP